MVYANFLQMVYRFIMLFGGIEFTFYKKWSYFVSSALLVYIMAIILIWVPLLLARVDMNELRKTIEAEANFTSFLFDTEPSLYGYHPKLNIFISVFSFDIIIVLVALLIAITIIKIWVRPVMKRFKASRSESTYRLQVKF